MTQPEKSALTPEMRAAQIWCLPAFSSREMDASFAQAIADAIREAVAAERERCAKIADPPLMHRKGRPGIWRRRRARIAADIRALPSENESLG